MGSMLNYIEVQRMKHADLEKAIHLENTRPLPDRDALYHLKVQKLRIKDTIEGLKQGSISLP